MNWKTTFGMHWIRLEDDVGEVGGLWFLLIYNYSKVVITSMVDTKDMVG